MGRCFFQEAALFRSAAESAGSGPGPGPGPGPNMGPYGTTPRLGGGGMSHYPLFANYFLTICSLLVHYSPTSSPLFARYLPTICAPYDYLSIILLFINYLLTSYELLDNHTRNCLLIRNYVLTISLLFPQYLSTICKLFANYS